MTETKKRVIDEDEKESTPVNTETNTEKPVETEEIKKKIKLDHKEQQPTESAASTTDSTKETEKKPDENSEKKIDDGPVPALPNLPTSIFGSNASPWSFSSFSATPSDPSKPFASAFGNTTNPFSFNLSTTSSFSNAFNGGANGESKEKTETTEEGSQDNTDEDYSKSSTYVPILQNLTPVQLETGEEFEKTLYSAKAKLYVFDQTYKERGVGLLKVNKSTTDPDKSRLVLNIDGSKRCALNVSIFSGMRVDTITDKSLRFTAFEDNKFTTFLVNLKKPEEREQFEKHIRDHINHLTTLSKKKDENKDEKKEEKKEEEKKEEKKEEEKKEENGEEKKE